MGRETHIMNISKGGEESPQGLLRDQRRQTAHEDRSIVWIRRRELFPVRPNKISQNRSGLSVMLPRLLRNRVSRRPTISLTLTLLPFLYKGCSNGVPTAIDLFRTSTAIRVLLSDLCKNVVRQIHHILGGSRLERRRRNTCA